MKTIDTFEFFPAKTDARDTDQTQSSDVLVAEAGNAAYEHTLPNAYIKSYDISGTASKALFPAEMQASGNGDAGGHAAHYPNNDWAMDLIDWGFDQIA